MKNNWPHRFAVLSFWAVVCIPRVLMGLAGYDAIRPSSLLLLSITFLPVFLPIAGYMSLLANADAPLASSIRGLRNVRQQLMLRAIGFTVPA